jgi:predicted Zn-dependent protease
LPGGFVYVHTALVARADDPSELGGVLGHEIAHAILRHGASQQQSRQVGAVVITAVCLFTGWCDGGLSTLALEAGQAAVFSKFSRTDELEADSAGVAYAAAAGLDPRGVVRFFGKLEEEQQRVPALLQVFSTHPMGKERIARVEELLGPAKAEPTVPANLVRDFTVLKRAVGAPVGSGTF